MRKTKAFKRVLSLLLVMLLMASMLPMSSLAADATSKEEASIELSGNPSEYVTMTLMAGKSLYHGATGQAFPKTTALTTIRTGYTGSNSGASNAVGYNYEAYTLETEDDYVTVKSSEANKQTLDSVAAKANGLFKDETNAGATAIEVSRGDTFYVAFNLEGTISEYKGLAGGSISLAIPTSAFSTSMASTAMLNGLVAGGGFSNPADPSSLSAVPSYLAYAGGYSVDSRGTSDNLTFGNGQTGAAITLAAGGNYYLPTKAEWIAVVPVTVKADAPTGTYYIGSSTASGGQDNATAILWAKDANGTGNIVSASEGADKTTGTLKANAITVKVVSNDASVSIPANTKKAKTTGRTLDVTVDDKGNFKDGGTFKILESTDGTSFTDSSIAVNSVTVSSNKKTATLTFDGTNLDKAKTYKIQVSSDAVDAVAPATVPATMLTGTFTACDPLSGTASNTGTNYGDDIIPTLTGAPADAGTLTYRWSKGTTYTANPSYGVTGGKVPASIYGGVLSYDGSDNAKMTFRITSAALDNTYVDYTTAAIGKKQLTFASSANVNLPAVKQDATNTADLTKTATYTYTTADGIFGSDAVTSVITGVYTATQAQTPSTADNDKTIDAANVTVGALTSTAAGVADRYIVPTNKPTVKGTVSPIGYKLAGDFTFVNNADDSAITGNIVKTGGVTIKGTYTGTITAGQELTGFTVSINGATATDIAAANVDLTEKTFTYKLPDATPTDVSTYTFAAKTGKGVTTVAFDDQSKDYDGDATFKGTITTKKPDGSDFALSDFGVTLAYSGADAGSTLTATGTQTTWTAANGDVYQLPTLTGTIGQATATTVKATVEGLKEGATAEEIVAAVKEADVMVDDITVAQGKVKDYATDADILAALKANSTIFTAGNKTVTEITDLTQSAADVTPAKIGDTIVITGVDVTEQLADVEGLTATFADNKTTIEVTGADIAETTIDLTPADDTDAITVKIAAAAGLEQGTDDEWTITAGDITVTLANITASGKFATNFDNANFNLAVTASIGRKSSGSGIPYDTKGYAVAGMDEVEVDEENKITSLTEVTDIVKGAVFTGWSTDGTKDHIVKVGYQFKENELENGLTAVFEGYMMGDNKGKVNAEKSVTRAELLKMLLVSSGKFDATKNYDYSKTEGFKDVKKDSTAWYVPYLACNLELSEDQRVIKGFEDGTFHPDDKVTREQAAVMIARAFGVKTEGATTTKVTDIDKIPSWARESVAAMCENGTINGFPDGTFRGGVSTARCQAAHMVNPYLGLEAADEKTIRDDATVKNPFPDLSKNHWAYHDLMFASLSVKSDYYQTEITIPGAAPAAPETPAE